jgi:hypothetical protein
MNLVRCNLMEHPIPYSQIILAAMYPLLLLDTEKEAWDTSLP